MQRRHIEKEWKQMPRRAGISEQKYAGKACGLAGKGRRSRAKEAGKHTSYGIL